MENEQQQTSQAANQETQQPAAKPDELASARARLVQLEHELAATRATAAEAETALARSSGDLSKIEEVWSRRLSDKDRQLAELEQFKKSVESDRARSKTIASIASVAGVAENALLRGVVREAEASGLFRADAEMTESEIKQIVKALEGMAPELFAKDSGTRPIPGRGRPVSESDAEARVRAIAESRNAGRSSLPEYLRR